MNVNFRNSMMHVDENFDFKKTFSLLHEPAFVKKLFGKNYAKSLSIFEKLNNLVAKHASYEYTTKNGVLCLLGDTFAESKKAEQALDCYPLAYEWRNFFKQEIGDFRILLQLEFILSATRDKGKNFGIYEFMNREFTADIVKFYGFDLLELKNNLKSLSYYDTVYEIIHLLSKTYWDTKYANYVAKNILISFLSFIGRNSIKKEYIYDSYGTKESRTVFIYQHIGLDYWMSIYNGRISDKEFADFFRIFYQYYIKSDFFAIKSPLYFYKGYVSVFDFGKAYVMGLIPESEMIEELTVRSNAQEYMSLASAFLFDKLTDTQQQKLDVFKRTDFSAFKELIQRVIDHILDVELKQPDSLTDVSPVAMKLEHIEGVAAFVSLLKAFKKESFAKPNYYFKSVHTKNEVLSELLRRCYPFKIDNAASLSTQLKGVRISDKQLAGAAMYAPQWAEIVEDYTGWKGLTNAIHFFHAHLDEYSENWQKAIIARCTPVDQEYLLQGAFDLNWFREIYKELGMKRMELLCKASDSITTENGHEKICKYASAINGKLKAKDIRKELERKRNKELLMLYCLIPLNKRSKTDLLERYRYLKQFSAESKGYSSQRQESEKKAVETGIQNLAINAGYNDVSRLMWHMESELISEIQPYLTPKEYEGVDIYIRITDEGHFELSYVKGDRPLSSIPARLRKHAYMEELRAVLKNLKNLSSRFLGMLEQFMRDGISFYWSELVSFMQNPVLSPLLKNLVYITEDGITGFYSAGALLLPGKESAFPEPNSRVHIAHPVELLKSNSLHLCREYMSAKEITQPFKQLFREVYNNKHTGNNHLRMDDLSDLSNNSRWLPNHTEGLQRIYFEFNIVATVSDTIEFRDRTSYLPIPIHEVPDIVFSEVIRDIDFAINGTYTASLSTTYKEIVSYPVA
ncbi:MULTISPECIES: DUF4132 domain-containing protein [unclassified Parabacteroides]|uniref:DUF4132 domain-containing protein n=1 Tax=unclassified Parabacteroides TaxID=2649774 RepID=UPI0024759AE5|nr:MULTISPECIES: DUF4132 domain-containing protein [unclassified Parabacteroides]